MSNMTIYNFMTTEETYPTLWKLPSYSYILLNFPASLLCLRKANLWFKWKKIKNNTSILNECQEIGTKKKKIKIQDRKAANIYTDET